MFCSSLKNSDYYLIFLGEEIEAFIVFGNGHSSSPISFTAMSYESLEKLDVSEA